MSGKNPEVFEGKHFKDIMKEIYEHAASKRSTLTTLMDVLAGMITTPNEAAIIAPLVKDYMEVAVKNDEHLVKMVAIMQRLMASEMHATGGSPIDSILSEEDKQKLLEEADQIKQEASKEALDELKRAVSDSEMQRLAEKTKQAVQKITPKSKTK